MSDIYRNLLRAGLTAATWIDRDDASRNAVFGYVLGRLDVTGGTANAIEASLLHPQGFTTLQDGALMWIKPTAANTGPVTIDIEGIGAVALRDAEGNALSGDELETGKAALIGYDSSVPELRLLTTLGGGGQSLLDVRLITATGTYVPTSGTSKVLAIGQAAGGGGRGGSITDREGGNGGAGETRIGAFDITGNVSVTVGAAGTGGSSSGDGGTAGDLIFGALMTCKGGTGGTSGTQGSTPTGTGGIGIPPVQAPLMCTVSRPGRGGGSLLGMGGVQTLEDTQGNGDAGQGYGGGGAGGTYASGNATGGAGAPGGLILIEFGVA